MEKRAFNAGEWPIAYEEVERYYPDAAAVLELPDNAYRKPVVAINACPNIVYKPFYLSPPVRFNEKYQKLIAEHPRVDLILNRTCTRLVRSNEVITAAEFVDSRNPKGKAFSIEAQQFVLACGGLGNPRILQLSEISDQSPVGDYLMDHPHLYGVSSLYLDKEKIGEYIE